MSNVSLGERRHAATVTFKSTVSVDTCNEAVVIKWGVTLLRFEPTPDGIWAYIYYLPHVEVGLQYYLSLLLVFLATVCGPVHTAKTSIDQIPLADECRFYITADV